MHRANEIIAQSENYFEENCSANSFEKRTSPADSKGCLSCFESKSGIIFTLSFSLMHLLFLIIFLR